MSVIFFTPLFAMDPNDDLSQQTHSPRPESPNFEDSANNQKVPECLLSLTNLLPLEIDKMILDRVTDSQGIWNLGLVSKVFRKWADERRLKLDPKVVDYSSLNLCKPQPKLRLLDMSGCLMMTEPELLKFLSLCPNLTWLNLDGTSVFEPLTDNGVKTILEICPQITFLNLSRQKEVHGENWGTGSTSFRNIKFINLTYMGANLRSILERCPNLAVVKGRLDSLIPIEEEALVAGSFSQVTDLEADYTYSEEHLNEILKFFPNLALYSLDHVELPHLSMILEQFPRMNRVCLRNIVSYMWDENYKTKYPGGFPAIIQLTLRGELSPEGCTILGQLFPNVSSLILSDCETTDADVDSVLANFKKLTAFAVRGQAKISLPYRRSLDIQSIDCSQSDKTIQSPSIIE